MSYNIHPKEYYLDDPPKGADIKINEVKQEISDVTGIMMDNIKNVLDRGETLDNIHNVSQQMVESASIFENDARKIKLAMRKKYFKMYFLCVVISLIVTIFVVVTICKPNLSRCF